MTWPHVQLNSWEDLTQQAKRTTSVNDIIMFRGQTRADWPLSPSIARAAKTFKIGGGNVIAMEQAMISQFRQVAHLYFPAPALPVDASSIVWLMLMQHYGAPTRLLDWTLSPYVAAYFACIDDWDDDGVVWWFHDHQLEGQMREQHGDSEWGPMLSDPHAPKRIHAVRDIAATERMVAQRGAFTICTQVMADHSEAIEEAFQPSTPNPDLGALRRFCRWVIPAVQKRSILEQLRAANITAATLFPGRDGLGLALKELLMMRMADVHEVIEMLRGREWGGALTNIGKALRESPDEGKGPA